MKKIKISISVILLLLQTMAIEAGVVQNEKGKCGYINESGALIIDYKYDFIGDFNQYGVAQVKNGKKYGMINWLGELTVPVKYDEIGFFQGGVAVLVSGKNYGLVSEQGKVLTDPQFVEIYSPNSQGVRIALKKQGKGKSSGNNSRFDETSTYSVLNRDGKILCTTTGGYIYQFSGNSLWLKLSQIVGSDTINTGSGYFAYLQKKEYLVSNLEGNIVLDNAKRVSILQEVYGPKAKLVTDSKWWNIERNPKEDVISFIYNYQKGNKKSISVVYGYYDIKNSKLIAHYTSEWRTLSSKEISQNGIGYAPTEDIRLFQFSNDYGVVWANQTGNERAELINRNGDVVATFPANGCYPYYNGYMVAKDATGKYGLLDDHQNVVIPYAYKSSFNYVSGEEHAPFLVLEDVNGNWGAIDTKKFTIVPFEYQSIKTSPNISTIYVLKNNRWGAYDNSVQLLECKYDSLDNYYDGAFLCHINRSVSVYSVTGKKMSKQVSGCNGVFQADKELHNSTFFRCFNIENGTDTIYGYIDGFADEVLPFVFDAKSKANNAYLIYKELPTMTFNEWEKYRLVLYFSRRERTYKLDGIVPQNDWDY